jgi:hypothetical protein
MNVSREQGRFVEGWFEQYVPCPTRELCAVSAEVRPVFGLFAGDKA